MYRKPDGIILPNSGYKNLIVYKKSDVIYQGTVVFCQRFLPPYGDRTVDQMTQAARSCKQNIVEGAKAAGVSTETELKLTGVARASLEELLEDYKNGLFEKVFISIVYASQKPKQFLQPRPFRMMSLQQLFLHQH